LSRDAPEGSPSGAPSGQPWGISLKFIALVSAAVAAFMLTAFVVTRTMLEDYAMRAADETADLILDQTDKRLVAFFGELEALARSLAGTRPVQEVDVAAMRDLFIQAVLARSSYLRAVYLGTEGGAMHEWGVGAEFVDYTPSFAAGYDPRVRPWYQAARDKGGFTVSAPYRYASVDDVGITCALPVSAPGGGRLGVLGLDILLSSLGGVLDGLQIPRGGKAVILGAKGEVIASQFESDRPSGQVLRRFEAGDALSRPQGGFSGVMDGQAAHYAYRRVDSLGWIVVVAMPLAPIAQSVRVLVDALVLVELLSMAALVLALAAISGRLIVSPLRHMVAVIAKVRAGRRGLRVAVDSGDEFGLLGDEFNRLLDEVEEYSAHLEDKVRARSDENARLQRENTRLRLAEERRRIYRDLHDTIGAKLTNVFFSASVAADLAKDGPERLRESIQAAADNCLAAVDSLKRVVLGMREDDARDASFCLIASAGLRRRLTAGGLAFDCAIDDKRAIDALPAGLLDEAEKLLDELATNALRHSGAASARLRLALRSGCLAMSFSDDGRGFDPAAAREGAGLGNIRYRVAALGGELRLKAAPGQGASYRIRLPLRSPGAAPEPAQEPAPEPAQEPAQEPEAEAVPGREPGLEPEAAS